MSTPPEQRPSYGSQMNMSSMMPMLGNAEFIVYLGATILVAIITLASKAVTAHDFVTAFTFISFAYLLSRGVAKASRVHEK
jgi:hypothetical protein